MLVDLGLPDGSGLDLIAECKHLRPQVSIMVMTMFSDPRHVFTALERGASGYLLKSADGAALAEQVLDLHDGGSPITPTVARLVVQRLSGNAPRPQASPLAGASKPIPVLDPGEALTAREVHVLNLIAVGYSYAEISNQLHISKHTVNAHIRSSYQKLQVHSRSEAVFEGQRRGLLSTPKR
jgi:DNA-binding NarL/FixJ family response regulator